MKQVLVSLIIFLNFHTLSVAQIVSGTIIDSSTDEPLEGATVMEKGSTNGTVTDAEGDFSLLLSKAPTTITVSYIGFESKSISISNKKNIDLGFVSLVPSALGLKEVIISGVIDIVSDRRTPVAVSTITSAEI